MRVCALIPAHNEAPTVRAVVAGALRHLEHVYVMDDGSTDGTAAAVAGLGAQVVRDSIQRGKGARLAQGFDLAAAAGFDAVLTLDADNQHDPDSIPDLLAVARAAPDAIVTGDRSAGMGEMGARRRWGIRFGNVFIGLGCRQKVRDAQCGMRVYPMALWRRLRIPARQQRGFLFETAFLLHGAQAGARIAHVPIAARYQGFVQRPSHFHPVLDFLRLFRLVAVFLIRARLGLDGLRGAPELSSNPAYLDRMRDQHD